MFTVAINGNEIVKCSNHKDARIWAARFYEGYADLIINNKIEDSLIASELYKHDYRSGLVITISGRNYENYIAEEDKISNRIINLN